MKTSLCQCVNTEHFSLTLVHVTNCLSIPSKLATHVQTLSIQSILLLYTPLICSPNPPQIPLTQAEMISDPLRLSLWGDNAQQLCSTSSISEDIHHANKRWSEQRAMFVKCLFAYSLLLFSIFNLHFLQTEAFSWWLLSWNSHRDASANWALKPRLWGWFYGIVNPSVLYISFFICFAGSSKIVIFDLLLLRYSLLFAFLIRANIKTGKNSQITFLLRYDPYKNKGFFFFACLNFGLIYLLKTWSPPQ